MHVPALIGELEQPSVFSFVNKTDKKYSTTDLNKNEKYVNEVLFCISL
jgi:hypothetical protein